MNNQVNDWNPDLYLKFKNERTQPSIDLASRIKIDKPKNIIDVGCGPGNSTIALAARWPQSEITGIDNSPAMIDKARNDYPEIEWKILDAQNINEGKKYNLVFSNAVIQWIPDHQKLIPDLFEIVNTNGALAVQIPMYDQMPVSSVVDSIALKERWSRHMKGCREQFIFHNSNFYYDILSSITNKIEIWETFYLHIMENHKAIIEMIRSTGMKSYLNRLEIEEDKIDFESEILNEIIKIYPGQLNGKVLFPFKRLFFIAYK